MYKVGFGFDSHKFKEGNFIILGGVKIDHYQSIEAHSDGDLIIQKKPNTLIQNTKKTQPLLETGLTQYCLQL